jgi:Phage tail protein
MDVKIIKKDNSEVLLSSLNFKVLDFIVGSPTPTHKLEGIEGANVLVDLGTTYESRPITLKLTYTGTNFVTGRNELFKRFAHKAGQETYYLVDMREPTRKWEVKAEAFTPDQLTDTRATVEIPFRSIGPYARVDTSVTYSTATFTLTNSGDDTVDPRFNKLKITWVGAATGTLRITHNGTGEFWQYTGTLTASDTVILNGVKATKNGLTIFKDTNRKLLKLLPGSNSFTISRGGATGAYTLTFEYETLTL